MLQILGASGKEAGLEGPIELLLGCHGRIRTFSALAARVASAEQAPEADVSDAARRLHRYHAVALPLHHADEELSITPRLERAAPPALLDALGAMKSQHHELDEVLAGLLPLWQLLAEEPGRRDELSAGLAREVVRMQALWARHLPAEEELIFPALQRLLEPAGLAEIADEMRARRAPEPSARSAPK